MRLGIVSKIERKYRGVFKLKSRVKTWQVRGIWSQKLEHKQEQDKSSDIEQQPPFGDRKISNIQPQNRGGSKPTGTSYNFDKV